MKPFDKIEVKTAQKGYNQFNLNCNHKTTMDFMTLQPIYYRHLIPNQSISIDLRSFVRMAAMPVPTFGDASLHLAAYFVPYRQVCPYFNAFMTDSVYTPYGGSNAFIPDRVHVVSNANLVTMFSTTSYGFATTTTASSYDFKVKTSATASQAYNFTLLGRQIFKILSCLGYRLQWSTLASENRDFSALPLLCYLRIYLDYYWPYQYRGLYDYKLIQKYLRYDQPHTFSTAELVVILKLIRNVCYDNDYFTSAFDSPTGPNNEATSPISVTDDGSGMFSPNQIGTYAYDSGSHSTAVITSDLESENSSPNAISQNSLNWLKGISNYLRRHQLAGSRTVDRFLARFGVKPSKVSSDICYRLGSSVVPMTVLDQMSTAETSEGNLGDYAGKGYIIDVDKNLPHFSYDAGEDFGMLIIVASIVPHVGYVQGIDRHNMELSRFDFYNPEYDALGCHAIDAAELYLPFDGTELGGQRVFTNVFGFIPRDAHRKVSHDWLTGDYVLGSHNQAGDVSSAWHLNRLISPSTFDAQTPDEIIHSPNFVFGSDFAQFDRLFYNNSDSADHFYCDFFFKVRSKAPMKKLFDFVDFDEDEHNNSVTLDTAQSN